MARTLQQVRSGDKLPGGRGREEWCARVGRVLSARTLEEHEAQRPTMPCPRTHSKSVEPSSGGGSAGSLCHHLEA